MGESLDDAKGLVHRRELLKALSTGRTEATLGELARPIHSVPEVAKLPAILKEFVQRRDHLFLVVDEYGGSVGIVTLEDVIETLLGVEIVDESDSVEDMQALAKQLVAKRQRRPRGLAADRAAAPDEAGRAADEAQEKRGNESQNEST